jgi:hypothetical protein
VGYVGGARRIVIAIGGTLLVLLAGAVAAFLLLDSALVFDPGGAVASASLVGAWNERNQPLRRLPFGVFYAMPEFTGELEIRCRDGAAWRGEYVTPDMQTWVRVERAGGCRRVTHLQP